MRRAWSGVVAAIVAPALALAQSGPSDPQAGLPERTLPTVNVVGAAPLIGSGMDRDKVPDAVTSVTARDVVRTGIPDALRALDETVPGVALDSAAGNEFQPDVLYRGFTASPNDGGDQGLAVYVNGARFNQPFGDSVLWDLVPSIAIDRINVEGANPVFGLNALGGSINVRLKNGFTYHGGELSVYGGSFGRLATSFQYGREADGTSAYVAGTLLHEDGWRNKTASDLRQFYADLGWRGSQGEAHLAVLGARNDLNGPGTSPVELLAVDRAAQFTAPNVVHNKYLQLTLSASDDISDSTSVQALAYYTNLSQRVVNGNTPNFQPCDAGNGALCAEDGATLLTDATGAPIPDTLDGGAYSELDLTGLDSNGYGASVQANTHTGILGFDDTLLGGVSFDGAVTSFGAGSYTGGLTDDRSYAGPGVLIDQPDGSIAPVRVRATNAYYGLYASDVLDLTGRLSLTLSGRLNVASISLRDQLGTALDGDHEYTRFNPGVGLTYKLRPDVSLYASYAESNRAPTPAELSCASIASPCTLANFFVGDPDLKQVVARTLEAGARGAWDVAEGGRLKWDIDLFRTQTQDDIVFSPSTVPGRDFFQNIGRTRRQGIEASMALTVGRVALSLGYALTDATFQSALTFDSPLNPASDANGQIAVRRGDRLPGVPLHRLKFGADWQVTPRWSVGARGVASSGQYLFGDEANLTPTTGAYVVVNANTSYRLLERLEVFAIVQNVFNARYATYGTFSDVTAVPIAQVPGATNTRSLSPAPPIAAYAGVRATF